ncbi:pyridoxamine 5'-phosphate oxidase family protein [Muriicola sp. Z0-33]|uniref:pyridoxamine 5'-phosphate oxidase family protein n=1 Tax=Muriicola sp. Z0-33 TaxID=2816957 RepID=UPI0022371420|nr:pyridoxamine 5'-phosphate oxidase family protein [Muriicola sp. Z0-33]MCW5515902.1 pyridoxamine 5'-phosphate oxidase family protein [Muriicola sp. Z0-33]
MENNQSLYPSDVVFTPAVKKIQQQQGSRKSYASMEERGGWQTQIDTGLQQFLAKIDSFYMGTANNEGQPYIQHRGGPKGFLKVLDEKRLAFADFRGNRQYISVGNLSENNKATLFLMDYPNRTRIKIWGTAVVVDDDEELLESLSDPGYRAKVERAIVFTVTAWDVNCPQHIAPRFTKEQLEPILAASKERIIQLETILKSNNIKF